MAIDYPEAMNWYLKSATQGHAAAQANLGMMYTNGQGVSVDYAEAYSWLVKAANQGDPAGFYNLGQLYEYGAHVTQDSAKAYAFYSLALQEKSEITDTAQKTLAALKNHMTLDEIRAGEQEVKKLMREYGLGG